VTHLLLELDSWKRIWIVELDRFTFVACDGGRYRIPLPKPEKIVILLHEERIIRAVRDREDVDRDAVDLVRVEATRRDSVQVGVPEQILNVGVTWR
jgi:hypothetical protein